MKANKSYTELDVWKKSRQLVKEVYITTKSFPNEELYALVSQIRRAAISIPSSIAEGIGRSTFKDTLYFLFVSRGSLYELETQLYLSNDLGFISSDTLMQRLNEIDTCKRLLSGFISFYQKKLEK